MNILYRLPFACTLAVSLVGVALLPTGVTATDTAAVASRAFNGYTRTYLPDKSVKQETYTFAEGGRWGGSTAGDSIDDLAFKKIIHTLAPALASRGYVPGFNPETTDLMIFVFWGTTQGTDGINNAESYRTAEKTLNQFSALQSAAPAGGGRGADGIVSDATAAAIAAADEAESALFALDAENRARDRVNESNARILGFQNNLASAYALDFASSSRDLVEELQASRYFVVLKAYDFRLAWKEKRRKVLWETRFSIRQQGNDFSRELAGMSLQASRYFGQETNGLLRRPLPKVRVDLGESKVMEMEATK